MVFAVTLNESRHRGFADMTQRARAPTIATPRIDVGGRDAPQPNFPAVFLSKGEQ
jgi:hypothetical protein